jgi:hypothetical protein
MAAVGHLHGRGVRVTVDGNDLHPQPLGLDHDFLPQLARTEEQESGGAFFQRCSEHISLFLLGLITETVKRGFFGKVKAVEG